jgi:hypothetical protein
LTLFFELTSLTPLSPPVKTARTVMIARRADGAAAEMTDMFPGQPMQHQFREITFPDMRKIRAADSVGLKVTGIPAPAEVVKHTSLLRRTPESDCTLNYYGRSAWPAAYRFSGKEMVGGLVTVKFAREDPPWRSGAPRCSIVRLFVALWCFVVVAEMGIPAIRRSQSAIPPN